MLTVVVVAAIGITSIRFFGVDAVENVVFDISAFDF